MNIVDIAAPRAVFADARSLRKHRREARNYALTVSTAEPAAAEMWETLRALGFDYSEIQWHVDNPGKTMRQGFVAL